MPEEVALPEGFVLRLVPAGESVPAFYLADAETTQAAYRAVAGVNPSRFAQGGRLPVENVSLLDAAAFCNALSGRHGLPPAYQAVGTTLLALGGRGFRLPTDAEWSYACRAGAGAPDERAMAQDAWFEANAGLRTHPVRSLKPNAFGLFDLRGNVAEWCWTPPAEPGRPVAAANLRGGGWCHAAPALAADAGDANGVDERFPWFGFRVARSP